MADVRWWPGRSHSVPAEVVVDEVRNLRKRYGVAQANMLVDRARPTDAPLHPLFEWDDSVAAEHYRVRQAQQIISSIRVTFHDQEQVAPMFTSVKIETDAGVRRGYVETARALSNQQMRAQVLKEAHRQLRAWQRRYRMFTELAKVVDAIDELDDED